MHRADHLGIVSGGVAERAGVQLEVPVLPVVPPAGRRTRAGRTAPRRPGSPGPKFLPPGPEPAGPPRTSRPAPPAGRRRGRRRARRRGPPPTVGSPRPGQAGGQRRTTGVAGLADRPAARRGGPDPPAPAPRDGSGQSSRAARRPPPAAQRPVAPPRTAGPSSSRRRDDTASAAYRAPRCRLSHAPILERRDRFHGWTAGARL